MATRMNEATIRMIAPYLREIMGPEWCAKADKLAADIARWIDTLPPYRGPRRDARREHRKRMKRRGQR